MMKEFYPKGSATREAFKTWHYLLGLTVFALVWLRLLARLAARVPPILPRPPQWQLRVAHVVELLEESSCEHAFLGATQYSAH
jgi:cytochrome b561